MTLRNNARLAGVAYLVYFAVGVPEMIVFNRVTSGEGIAAKLANIARHPELMRLSALLNLFTTMSALALAVTLYALTRDTDRDLSLFAMTCRLGEGITGAMHLVFKLAVVRVATTAVSATGVDAAAAHAVGSSLLSMAKLGMGAMLFAIGSTIFCWLFLRARSIPAWLAWLGIFASALLAVYQPLQLMRLVPNTFWVWIPAAVFELTLAFWLLVKGVAQKEPV